MADDLRRSAAEQRTNHRLRFLIDQLQAGIAENRLDVHALTWRLNELANEVAELKRQQRDPGRRG